MGSLQVAFLGCVWITRNNWLTQVNLLEKSRHCCRVLTEVKVPEGR
jgi:hypothetical protein